MANHTQAAPSRAITVPFNGADLYVVEHESQPYTPMKPIITGMGLTWHGQHAKIKANARRWGILELRIPSSGGLQDMLCMPLRKLPGWLSGIEAGKVKNEETRAKVVDYQNECDDVLWQYWNDGIAINPRALYSVNPGDVLTKAEADTLRQTIESMAKKLSPDTKVQGKFIMQAWSKLKSHFKVAYREIPRHELTEAISIVNRHTVEWELVDEAPKAGTLNETVAHLVKQVEAPNGAPAILFMPLVNVVLKKMEFKLPGHDLPHFEMTVRPPDVGTQKHDRDNPYPRNGRTIETAKSIVGDIGVWANQLPTGHAKRDLTDAVDTLHRLLVSGWTEVDEAMGQLSMAMYYLNRWQGRGGRIGNVA